MKKTILALSVLLFLTNQYQSFGQTLGEQCNPEKGSNRPGITCQATDEWLYTQPYIQNAKKGDVIVSAVDGMISGLLRNVNPPQKFSHSGIMVSNYSTIRHSTAVPERTRRNAGSDGFDINLLKYGWPGTLTETIDDAYEGQYHVDPEGFSYFIKSFNLDPVNYPGDTAVIFPSVVKPPIDFEANPAFDVRSKLELIADEAENIEGHYRFFAYTDGSIVGNLLFTASAEAPWAFFDAQNGTVCSELIWNAANRAKLTRPDLEIEDPIIEPTDRSHPSSPAKRGLFIYSEGERRAAGDWLYNEVYNAFYEEAGWFGRLFTDAPDDGANQIVNCFGFDWCGEEAYRHFIPSLTDQTLHSEPTGGSHSKDSDRWKNPGIGVALAPDDIRFNWDLPPTGLYGAAQNIAYRTGRYIRVHRWTRSEGTADVIVNITFEGNPLENAEVKILGFPEELTDSSGQTQFVAIPGGHYVIEASKTIQMDFEFKLMHSEQRRSKSHLKVLSQSILP
ncbi:MAG: hypothetical protein MRK02_13800 [Candidatus Scalindua sp.]|nr:hypothetical protein [Candidatus Scalindua sp.]